MLPNARRLNGRLPALGTIEFAEKGEGMGNLGWYQTMTSVTKALGGPKKALAIVGTGVAVVGYGVFRGVEAGGKKEPCSTKGSSFVVTADAEAGGGLVLRAGMEYRVLECDDDAVQIEVIGDGSNPYFVSGSLLSSISDYPGPNSTDGGNLPAPVDPA